MGIRIGEDGLESLRKVAFALDQYEPFPRTIIPEPILDRLIDVGLVESGRSCRPAVSPIGYRLTPRGWQLATEHWTERRAVF